jgi:hypothetical protein
MTTFPNSPRTLRGAIAAVSPLSLGFSLIIFQLNPESLTRSLAPKISGEGGSRAEAFRLDGAPVETLTAKIELDATDQLEVQDPNALSMGLHPQIASLELLVTPPSVKVIANTVLLALGTIEIIPPEAPLTLFAWGPRRIVPVILQGLSVTEEAYDVNLNPIRASATLTMRVLTYDDLPLTHPGYSIYLGNQVLRETMARIAQINDLSAALGGNLPLL